MVLQLEGVGLSFTERGLLKKTREHRVLQDVSFDVRSGETLGILGRNGAGKSSLMRMLAGVIQPDTGVVRRFTERVVLLSYQLGFNPHLSGRENAIHSVLLQGVSRIDADDRLEAVIEFSGLEDNIDLPLQGYSAGMRARLGFAAAIQSDPDVILIDESLGVGDHEFRAKSMAFMKNWIRSNKTVVFVSHDEDMVRELCDRVVWIENGRVAMFGMVDAVLLKYHQFDDYVTRLARVMKATEAQVRNDPSSLSPLAALERFESAMVELDVEEKLLSPRSIASGVHLYRPKLGDALFSRLIDQPCGVTAWVEGMYEICQGSRVDMQPAFEQYSDLQGRIAAATGSETRDLHAGGIGRSMRSLMALTQG